MRQETFAWIITAVSGMGCSLGYAIRTLYRMQGKSLYPLLRIRSKEGRCSPVVLPRNKLRPAARLPFAFSGYPWS